MCGCALERHLPTALGGEGRRWTCPMHAEVIRDAPGACPICGMDLEPMMGGEEVEDKTMERRMWLGAALTLPLFLMAMTHLFPGARDWHWLHEPWARWLQWALATPVVFGCGWTLFERGLQSLFTTRWNMFTLIMLGVGAAYGFSVVALVAPGIFPESLRAEGPPPLYFEASAVIVVLVLAGQVMEGRARSRTSAAIQALLTLAPPSAVRVADDGDETVVPLEEVKKGDRLRVKPGAKMPVDGVVLEGRSTVDESMITGESVPVSKEAGDEVTAGTVNGHGSLLMQAEKVGEETLLARMVKMVAEARRSRAPIQSVADRVAAWFAPAVVVCAGVTALLWGWWGPEPRLVFALVNALAVLIIACPCALGLATPMSIMVGVGRGAREGVLVRNAEALERLERAEVLVMDKTGTLTQGMPTVTQVLVVGEGTQEAVLRWAASVEQASEHPLAAAVVRAARERGVKLAAPGEVSSQAGRGVRGTLEGRIVRVGKPGWIEVGQLLEEVQVLQKQARTVMLVEVEEQLIGAVAVADPIKPNTAEAIRMLHELGLRLMMVTGDNAPTAEAVARELGIDEVLAGMLPEEKIAVVKRLQKEGRGVVMAGDGINDAPALAQADVGIAMGTGTDVAMESAGVTLVKGDLRGIAKAVRLSRATLRNIRQNLFFAFAYNAIGIPVAAGVLYPLTGTLLSPMLAGLAMSFSSVSVIANALRLRRVVL